MNQCTQQQENQVTEGYNSNKLPLQNTMHVPRTVQAAGVFILLFTLGKTVQEALKDTESLPHTTHTKVQKD